MKKVLTLAAIGVAILWLAAGPSSSDELARLAPVADLGSQRDIFVEAESAHLPVTPAYFAVPGHPTIVIFHNAECPACAQLDRALPDFSRSRPDVAIRKVSIEVDDDPRGPAYYWAIENYQWAIYATPTVLIYGADGKLVAGDEKLTGAGSRLLRKWMEREAQRQTQD